MQLLAGAMVRLRYVGGPRLGRDGAAGAGRNEVKPWLEDEWVIPPGQSAEFCWHMEDVPGVYHRPHGPEFPVVGLDEKPVQLVADAREPPPPAAAAGQAPGPRVPAQRHGQRVLRVRAAGPLAAAGGGWRRLAATDRRTRVVWAHFVKGLVDAPRYRDAGVTVLVMDQLNTHTPASLYEAFEPAEAKRVADKLEVHHTPKHGSWLNVAEVELSVLGKRLKERVGDKAGLADACAAFERERNRAGKGVDWQFNTADARVKLKRLYPTIEVS